MSVRLNGKIVTENLLSGDIEDELVFRCDSTEDVLKICYRYLRDKIVDIEWFSSQDFAAKLLKKRCVGIADDGDVIFLVRLFD